MLITHKRTRSQILARTQSIYDSNNDVYGIYDQDLIVVSTTLEFTKRSMNFHLEVMLRLDLLRVEMNTCKQVRHISNVARHIEVYDPRNFWSR